MALSRFLHRALGLEGPAVAVIQVLRFYYRLFESSLFLLCLFSSSCRYILAASCVNSSRWSFGLATQVFSYAVGSANVQSDSWGGICVFQLSCVTLSSLLLPPTQVVWEEVSHSEFLRCLLILFPPSTDRQVSLSAGLEITSTALSWTAVLGTRGRQKSPGLARNVAQLIDYLLSMQPSPRFKSQYHKAISS